MHRLKREAMPLKKQKPDQKDEISSFEGGSHAFHAQTIADLTVAF
jgi:hypothetical protein